MTSAKMTRKITHRTMTPVCTYGESAWRDKSLGSGDGKSYLGMPPRDVEIVPICVNHISRSHRHGRRFVHVSNYGCCVPREKKRI